MTADGRRELIERAAAEVFAERGYRGASIEEIARRSGVTAPVVYDHFASKHQLLERLLERHYAELRHLWYHHAGADGAGHEWIPRAIEAWFVYVESNPFAGRMLFHDTTGDPEIEAIHRDTRARSRAGLLPLVTEVIGGAHPKGLSDPEAIELAWEALRGVLQGLALWWSDHPDVARATVVAAARNAVWVGFERALAGEDRSSL